MPCSMMLCKNPSSSYMKQQTIEKTVSLKGIGLHTGQTTTVSLLPAPENHGVKFKRVDIEKSVTITADPNKVSSSNRSTCLQVGETAIHTVEHLLSALAASAIDNVLVEVEGMEIPILDGSAKEWVKLLKKAGKKEQEKKREYLIIEDIIEYKDEETGAEFIALPSNTFEVKVLLDYEVEALNGQYATLSTLENYAKEIAPCKTFVLLSELEKLAKEGLIKGGSLDNAIVFSDKKMSKKALEKLAKKIEHPAANLSIENGILNTQKLNFPNEAARHKLLDLIGDLALINKPIKGKIIATKPGHQANTNFAKKLKTLFLEQKKLKGKPRYNPDTPPLYNSVQIQELLPHRHPFLLVDKIIELSDTHVVGVKNVTHDEYFFQGHFPGNPVMPGVLQMEALAQAGGILALSLVDPTVKWNTYFLKIDNAKFKNMVVPGDTVILKMELLAPIRRGVCQMRGTAYVGNKIVSEGDLTAQIVKREIKE